MIKFNKKNFEKKNLRPNHWIFFRFSNSPATNYLNCKVKKNKKFKDPYEKFTSEKSDFRCFRAVMHPEFKTFCVHVKFPEKISLQKKIIFFYEYV